MSYDEYLKRMGIDLGGSKKPKAPEADEPAVPPPAASPGPPPLPRDADRAHELSSAVAQATVPEARQAQIRGAVQRAVDRDRQINLAHERCNAAEDRGDHAALIGECHTLLETCTRLCEPGHTDIGIAENRLGKAYRLAGRYADAVDHYARAYQIANAAGEDSLGIAVQYAKCLRAVGRDADADAVLARHHTVFTAS